MKSISGWRTSLEQQRGKQIQLEKSIKDMKEKIIDLRRSLRQHEQARELIREAGLRTQERLQYHISDISSMALGAVFDDPYELSVEFVHRRNKSECDLMFVRRGQRLDPMDSTGGGVQDVAANALRIASYSMQVPKSRNVLILDEPYKHLRGVVENERVLTMIKEISDRLGLQVIMIGDEKVPKELIMDIADRVFEMSIKREVSQIKVLK